MRFIHMTDLHITAKDQPLYGLSPHARLHAAISCINRDFDDVAFVALTGDLANRGTEAEYEALREILGELEMPHYLLMGNHDRRAAFRQVFADVPVDSNGFVQYAFTVEDNHFIVMDTLDEGKVTGLLCQQRLDWLAGELENHAAESSYLFLHHPPLRIEGGKALAKMIAGRVKHIFFGHVHRPMHGSWQGIPISSQHSTVHQFVYKFGDPVTQGVHEPPTFAAVNMVGGNVMIIPHAYLDDSPRFNMRSKDAARAASPEELPPLP
ncbi:MAG: phosphodiesterase [Rhodospirillaceae bacterium]|jgi:3',5'-cyclic-AMP phosphodiesterase|nr:phosphodiesterase [Rhodospirillaceae bacterium]MBT3493263.1 phosphodiesterase [Rhodospirillaceae bacterium]MBT3782165.1 phosphodiesterase [Rhodospirillaceae bacterium]MBT3977684.1 phosphodiesterase [Rhodospirillaceae bacterium]MBT4169868.1 phosphodiesterase [Rhodospirillaceae bacterium]